MEDETIAIYSAPTFSAEIAAKIFFSEHSESEVNNKLHELANLQGQIELILRQKVRENYNLFMHANNEIQRVGVEMADLKHLIDTTKKILQEVKNAQPNPELRQFKPIEKKMIPINQSTTKTQTPKVSDTIPTWVRQAPQDIDRLIIEQQYHQAVNLIKRATAFLESIKDLGVDDHNNSNDINPVNRREDGISVQIQKRSFQLAMILKDSLVQLPNSELWGIAEQTKRLQLLVKLGHKDIAAQGFSTGRKDMIRKAMRYVEASGDVEKFTAELSRVFFTHLKDACKSFMELFSQNITTTTNSTSATPTASTTLSTTSTPKNLNQNNSTDINSQESDMASLSYLVGWIQDQMSVFVAALARQIQLGAADYRSKVFEQNVHTLRNYHQQKQKTNRSRPGSTRMSRSAYDLLESPDKLTPASLTPERTLVRSSSLSAAKWSRTSLSTTGFNSVRGRLASISGRDSNVVTQVSTYGPLTFTSRCLQVAYREAMVLDQLGLQGGASLSWHIVPEIKSIINSFTEDIIKVMEEEVSKDDWTPIKCLQPEVKFPGKNSAIVRDGEKNANKEDNNVIKKSSSTISSLFGGVTFENEDDNLEITESNVSEVEIFTSSSYDWIVAVLTYFIGEVLALLQVDMTNNQDDNISSRLSRRSMSSDNGDARFMKDSNSYYSRIDFCELDPEIVACFLRIVVRYIRAMMAVDSKSLQFDRLECYQKTVEEISVSLLPSVEDVLTKGFFSDGSTLVSNPPKVIFSSLRRAVDVLQRGE